MTIKRVAGDWKEVGDRVFGDMVLVSGKGKQQVEYENIVGVDWKESPDEVVSQVNEILKENKIPLQFIYVVDGSDSYWFGTAVKAKKAKKAKK